MSALKVNSLIVQYGTYSIEFQLDIDKVAVVAYDCSERFLFT